MSATGFLLPAASLGLGALLFKPRRGFYKAGTNDSILVPHAVVSEDHSDTLMITKHPVEVGATISDHAYKEPARVTITCLWSNSPPSGGLLSQAASAAAAFAGRTRLGTAIGVASAAVGTIAGGAEIISSILSGNAKNQVKEIYAQLLALQESAIMCDVYTGKRSYKDMLLREVAVKTVRETENALAVIISCEQIIVVDTQIISVPLNSSALQNPQANMPTTDTGGRALTTAPKAVLP